ncbi:MAG: pyruvate kinase, partial [Sphingomonadales bacterium]
VARGDLGVEARVEEVPSIQRDIIKRARRLGKPVVVATQMLETMIHSPVPTRAEVSDVANAVYAGTDAIMLSAETAAGRYPVEAVAMMDKVARQAEQDPFYLAEEPDAEGGQSDSAEDAITAAAKQVTRNVKAAAVVTFTTSGSTALRAARERPSAPILALTPNAKVARKLCMVWGLHTLKTKDIDDFEEMIGKAKRMALRQGLARAGQRIVITAGVPFGTPGATNVLHIAWITGDELDGHDSD